MSGPGWSGRPRAGPGPLTPRSLDLLHELEEDPTRRLHESDATGAERAADRAWSPQDRVAIELGIEVIDEQGRMQEAFVGELAGLLIDGLGEESERQGAQLHVSPTAVLPLHRLGDRGTGSGVPGAGRLEVGHLDGQIRHARD